MTTLRTLATAALTLGLVGASGVPVLADTAPARSATAGFPAHQTPQPAPLNVDADRARVHASTVRWSSDKRWRRGERNGVVVREGSIRIGDPVGIRRFNDPYGATPAHRYAYGRWVSPWVHPGFRFRQAVPSWSARTPKGTWLQPEIRVRTKSGRLGSWDVLGHWQGRLRGLHDSSLGTQADDVASVAVDTVKSHSAARAWQLRVTLFRRVGTDRSPVVASATGVASTPPPARVRTSSPGPGRGRVVAVPRYSQMTHRGHYPQWGGGGEAWCSPTSMAMILASWHRGPTRKQYAWVKDSYRDPWVEHAARMVYDHRYDGTGNWSFTTAYAGTRGLDAFVTRLPSLRAAERYIRAGIPLVLSIAFDAGQLDGAPISSSNGHLLVLRGFTKAGRPVVNDPAAANNRSVRRVYSRRQLERAWVTSTAGTAYVVHRQRVALPRTP